MDRKKLKGFPFLLYFPLAPPSLLNWMDQIQCPERRGGENLSIQSSESSALCSNHPLFLLEDNPPSSPRWPIISDSAFQCSKTEEESILYWLSVHKIHSATLCGDLKWRFYYPPKGFRRINLTAQPPPSKGFFACHRWRRMADKKDDDGVNGIITRNPLKCNPSEVPMKGFLFDLLFRVENRLRL